MLTVAFLTLEKKTIKNDRVKTIVILEVLFKFFKNGNTLIAGRYTALNLI